MENRLQTIYEAASSLFINKGYIRTQMKDIAKAVSYTHLDVYKRQGWKHALCAAVIFPVTRIR